MSSEASKHLRLEIAAEDLCEILERLTSQHQELFELLVDKEAALVEVRISDIEECRQREEGLLRGVIDEEKERLLVTEEIGDLLDHDEPASIRVAEMAPHLADPIAQRLRAWRDRLRETALKLARQNSINRALIEHSMGHVQVFMSRLVNQEFINNGYDKDGHKSAGSSNPFLTDRRA